MNTIIIYVITVVAILISLIKDSNKTVKALKKAIMSLEKILPQFLTVIFLVALAIAFLDQEKITQLLGDNSGIWGILAASIVGSITLIPGFVAFPAAAELLENGAAFAPIAAFVSSLMMVGIVTLPLEISYFGKKISIIRNSTAFVFSIIAAFFVSWMVSI
ncbi:permease [Oceanispirochaeta crateris]|uniref:permease n=1 Tax=Oceanispirochaeta crateris TaxID=2518645 RepID=UPI00143DD042|nr:permease [Oceanispirochaeta crateris]